MNKLGSLIHALIVVYLTIAFLELKFNPLEWSIDSRIWAVLLTPSLYIAFTNLVRINNRYE